MKKHLFGVVLMVSLVVAGGAFAQYTDIGDIQVYDVAGAPASPYDGQVVTVRGVLYERGQFSGGSHYVQDATGGLSIYLSPATAALWDEVEVTGTIGSYSGEIQMGSASFTVLSSGNTVADTPFTIPQLLANYDQVGLLVSTIGVVTSKPNASNFFMADGGDTIQVYIDSTTGIDLGLVDVGDTYKVIAPLVNYNTTRELKPRFQTDLIENPEGDTLPQISGVNCANWVPLAADPIVVTASITDDLGITGANLYYRDSDGVTPGAWSSVAMSNTVGDVYEGTIPGGHSSSQVDFYLDATDTGAQTVTFPGDAPVGFIDVAVGITTIYAMQTVHPDSSNQDNNFMNKVLNIRGVITAGTGQVGAASKFMIQEQDKNPETDSYAFGGVLVYESSAAYEYFQGDLVEIGGYGDEYFGMTEMIPHNGDAVNLIDFGQALPEAPAVQTRILADDVTNGGEAWEAVWVKTFPAAVIDTLGYGDYLVADKDSRNDSLTVSPIIELTYVPTIGDVLLIESYMSYDYGAFTIVPVADEFVTLTGLTDAEDTPTVVSAGGFRGIAPNPFNPATKISFSVNENNLVQLNVYNLRGEKVRTLVQGQMPANEYDVFFDGRDDNGQSLSSGQYFARLRIGKEVMQVRKMSLVK